jgi:flagellar biosynthetic protein FliR
VTDPAAAWIAQLPALAFAFMLVLARSSGVVMLLPGLSEPNVPAMIRAGIAGALAILLTPEIAPMVAATPATPLEAGAAICAELATGLWLGFLARVIALALPVAGQIIAGQLGLSNVLQPDPDLGPQTSALSALFGLAVPTLVLVSGLYALPISALAGSYRLIAPGTAIPSGDTAEAVARGVEQAFALALRLSAPAILLSVSASVAGGVLARLAPRLQVYFLAMPVQILAGVAMLAAVAAALLSAWEGRLHDVWSALPGHG